ncbi:MAG: alpha/beta hydrolase [Bacteroidota bacterium]|nr:alpha/beta hydrolase [Bacteroidota bacterium]MDP4247144.1 alpha/beta hydrolase [Bacteroidota bacterium]MDP4256359.1 alpha/beta hydrolase [Bacteroidota bacterium]
MNRNIRVGLLSVAAPLLVGLCFSCQAQTVMPLYHDSIPNSRPGPDEEKSEIQEGNILIISKISRPTLTLFLPPKDRATGTAVVICPGGGYWVEAAGHEGADVARKFNEWGVAAILLKYRIPNEQTMIDRSIGALQDAQQAIKVTREHAAEWNINPSRVGIMGFSAGGHLASTAGTHFNHAYISNSSQTSLRPDFMLLIYPVISFQDSIGHIGSRDQLIGKRPMQEQKDLYSNELQVTDQTPPSFLVHASDDDVVNVKNSINFYLALLRHNIPAELHLYEHGGHGFGMHLPKSKEEWMDRCRNWMDASGFLKP